MTFLAVLQFLCLFFFLITSSSSPNSRVIITCDTIWVWKNIYYVEETILSVLWRWFWISNGCLILSRLFDIYNAHFLWPFNYINCSSKFPNSERTSLGKPFWIMANYSFYKLLLLNEFYINVDNICEMDLYF